MLKIKSNIDLKELKCDTPKDDFIWAYKELLFDRDTRIINQNQFYVGGYLTATRLENLYDLIKADLIEKVGDE